MSKAELKKDAYFHASQILKNAIEQNIDLFDARPELEDPLWRIVDELRKRSL